MNKLEAGKDALVTVIVPVYMIEDYIDRCILSIRNQSYFNLEIIIINDGTTDDSLVICERHMKDDDRIKVITQENRGLSAARNEGIRQAHGKWLTFVDGDDWIEPEMIDRLVDVAEKNSAQISCCGHYCESRDIVQSFKPREEQLTGKAAVGEWLRNRNIKMMAWGKLYSRELFKKETFFPEGRSFEDTASCWQLFNQSQVVMVIPDCLYHYCIRSESISNSHSVRNIIDRWPAFLGLFNTIGTQNEEFEKLTMRMCFSCIEYAWHERFGYSEDEWVEMIQTYNEMAVFSKAHIKECRKCGCNILERICAFCACINSSTSFSMYRIIFFTTRIIKNLSFNRT